MSVVGRAILRSLGLDDAYKGVVDRVMSTLGDDATEAAVKSALRKQGVPLPSKNPLAVELKRASKPLATPKAKASPKAKSRGVTERAPTSPMRVIAEDYGADVANRLDGLIDPKAPLEEWRAAADRISTVEANLRSMAFSAPGTEPVATQAGRAGFAVGGREQAAAQHPSRFGVFSSYKTRGPVEETRVDTEPFAVLPSGRKFDLNRLENAKIVPLYGDRMRAGDTITNVGGLPTYVRANGGPLFAALQEALGGKAGWASAPGALSSIRRAIETGLDDGRSVFGVYVPMGPGAVNQTTEMTDLLHQMAQNSPILKRDVLDFDRQARADVPGYAGLLDEDAPEQLRGMTQGQRKAIVSRMDSADFLRRGFPDVPAARYALTDRNLVDVPAGASGYSIVEFGPESLKSLEGGIRHPTYSDSMAGTFEGGAPLMPFDMLFSDFIGGRRNAGLPAGSDLRAIELSKPSQVVEPEQFDRLMRYLRLTGQR